MILRRLRRTGRGENEFGEDELETILHDAVPKPSTICVHGENYLLNKLIVVHVFKNRAVKLPDTIKYYRRPYTPVYRIIIVSLTEVKPG